MSGKSKLSATLPPGVILILLLLACGLAVHFIAEDLTIAMPGLELAMEGESESGAHEHGEDHFIFSVLCELLAASIALRLLSPALSGAFSFSLSPQSPPPNI
jgi:hypothetical protein